ncbi:hypothetical protein J2T20_000035 [Paenibacillus wynnii]|nr:hypothetical protein [Paenibacillus wynnii]
MTKIRHNCEILYKLLQGSSTYRIEEAICREIKLIDILGFFVHSNDALYRQKNSRSPVKFRETAVVLTKSLMI